MNFLNFNNWEAYDVNNIKYINYDLKEKNKKTYKKNNILAINNQKLSHIDLYYKTNNRINITTPEMKCLFGLVDYGNSSYIINLQFTNYKTDSNMKNFLNFIQSIEINNLKHIGLNEDNNELYLSQIQINKKYDPNLIVKVPFRYTKFEVECKNSKGEDIYINNIPRFSKVRCDIYIDKIWKFNENYVCKWKLNKLQLL